MKGDEHFKRASGASSPRPPYHAAHPRREPRRVPDRLHVDLSQDWEIQLWTRQFDCTEAALRRAVNAVGNEAGEVRVYLRRHHS